MKALRLLAVLMTISIVMMIQGCGSGGGSTDTAGSLTITSIAASDNGDGNSTVSFNVTYTPPAGKTAQGVVVKIDVNGSSINHTYSSGSNTVIYTDVFPNGSYLSISASVNSMTSSTVFFVPITGGTGGTGTALAVATTTADFLATDAANSIKTIIVSGGTAPYTVSSTVPADISPSIINFSDGTGRIVIELLNSSVLGTPATASVRVTDSAGAFIDIAVSYFK